MFRLEIQRTSPEGGQDIIYIGEADRLGRRLIQQQTKDFWTTAYVFTAKDGHLNKAHVQYLEKNLLRLAQEARRYRLDNQDSGNDISLYDLDEADANAFLKEVLLCCPLIGLKAFQDDLDGRALTDSTTDQSGGTKGIGKGLPDRASGNLGDQRIFYSLYFPENSPGLKAVGFCSAGHFGRGFTVLKGAKGKREFAPSTPDHHRRARDELLRQNILYDTGSVMELRQDHEFSSPSQAASVLLGRSASGPREWKDSQGNALGEKRNQTA